MPWDLLNVFLSKACVFEWSLYRLSVLKKWIPFAVIQAFLAQVNLSTPKQFSLHMSLDQDIEEFALNQLNNPIPDQQVLVVVLALLSTRSVDKGLRDALSTFIVQSMHQMTWELETLRCFALISAQSELTVEANLKLMEAIRVQGFNSKYDPSQSILGQHWESLLLPWMWHLYFEHWHLGFVQEITSRWLESILDGPTIEIRARLLSSALFVCLQEFPERMGLLMIKDLNKLWLSLPSDSQIVLMECLCQPCVISIYGKEMTEKIGDIIVLLIEENCPEVDVWQSLGKIQQLVYNIKTKDWKMNDLLIHHGLRFELLI